MSGYVNVIHSYIFLTGPLTQLYILGNSLRREVQHTLAIRSMEVAIIVCERSENVDENLKMKLHFVLGQSQQGIEKVS